MKLKSTIFSITIFFLSGLAQMNGQEINRFVLTGAGNEAMGNANVAYAFDVSAMYINPATLVFMKKNSVYFNHSDARHYLGMDENLSYPILNNNSHAVSVGLNIYHFGYVNVDKNDRFGGQQILEVGYNAAYAATILPSVSVGVSASIRNGKTNNTQVWTGSYAIGLAYDPSADISYGIVLRGLGWDVQYIPNESDALFPEKNFLKKSIEIGSTMSFPSSASLRRKFFVLSLSNQKIFNVGGLIYKAGVELSPYDFLKFRFGYVAGPSLNDPRFGVAFKVNNILIEYTIFTHKTSTIFDQFSFSMGL